MISEVPAFSGFSLGTRGRATHTPPFRQYVWILHEASSRLFEEVGKYPPGKNYPAAQFVKAFPKRPIQIRWIEPKT